MVAMLAITGMDRWRQEDLHARLLKLVSSRLSESPKKVRQRLMKKDTNTDP